MDFGSMSIGSQNSDSVSRATQADTAQLKRLRAVAASLNSTKGTGREFVVVRDRATQRFVVQVLEPGTKTVLDQFPAESILKQLSPEQ